MAHPDLFAYGTLMAPEIIRRIIGRVPDSKPAHAQGFRRFAVAGHNFPGILRTGKSGDRVDGLLYFNISPGEWAALHDYEDDFYVVEEITVHTDSLSSLALCYLVPAENAHVLGSESWDFDHFLQHHLSHYLS